MILIKQMYGFWKGNFAGEMLFCFITSKNTYSYAKISLFNTVFKKMFGKVFGSMLGWDWDCVAIFFSCHCVFVEPTMMI